MAKQEPAVDEVVEPVVEAPVEPAAPASTLYAHTIDIDVVGPNALVYSFQAGVPREIPESVVEAALAVGVQAVR